MKHTEDTAPTLGEPLVVATMAASKVGSSFRTGDAIMIDEKVVAARRRACKKLQYETQSRECLVFGKTTAATLIGVTPNRLERLIQPTDFVANQYYKSGPPVGLYDPTELVRLAKRKSVKDMVADIDARRSDRQAASRRAVETKRQKALAELEEHITSSNWTSEWPRTLGELRTLAVETYNDLHYSRGHHEKYACGNESQEFISRIAVNFLRHERTDYEWLLQEYRGRVGIAEIHDALKRHIETLCYEMYPGLQTSDDE
ncbi:hypothetical protein M0R72_00410 [Candidatus Pacearchaeota archaeon]|nr:hypothetical protein [Candidatus Pacearchaeota archaeon]